MYILHGLPSTTFAWRSLVGKNMAREAPRFALLQHRIFPFEVNLWTNLARSLCAWIIPDNQFISQATWQRAFQVGATQEVQTLCTTHSKNLSSISAAIIRSSGTFYIPAEATQLYQEILLKTKNNKQLKLTLVVLTGTDNLAYLLQYTSYLRGNVSLKFDTTIILG